MKTLLKVSALVLLSVLVFSCGIQRGTSGSKVGKLDIRDTISVKDSTEYDLIVFDSGFDYWLNSRSFSKNQYSNDYLQTMNNQYSREWNRRYSLGDRRIESNIDYNVTIKYDFEFNYKLFMYFKYFEETNRMKLLNMGGRP
jgi:hypothetical protein